MGSSKEQEYVGRGGEKLKYAIERLGLSIKGLRAADFGCNVGGFTDCLLKEGAIRVYAVDTGYGVLDWSLRNDDRVIVMEHTNAMHVRLPERVDLITVDAGWTPQRHILPNALQQVNRDGFVLSLFKPQYEAEPRLVRRGRLPEEHFGDVLQRRLDELAQMGIRVSAVVDLPRQKESKNRESMLHVRASECSHKEHPEYGRQEGN